MCLSSARMIAITATTSHVSVLTIHRQMCRRRILRSVSTALYRPAPTNWTTSGAATEPQSADDDARSFRRHRSLTARVGAPNRRSLYASQCLQSSKDQLGGGIKPTWSTYLWFANEITTRPKHLLIDHTVTYALTSLLQYQFQVHIRHHFIVVIARIFYRIRLILLLNMFNVSEFCNKI